MAKQPSLNSVASSSRQRVNVSRIALFLLRISMGWLFLYAGFSKLTAVGGWSASSYLVNLKGPLAGWFASMAGNAVIDQLNIWGLMLIGMALLLGLLTRFASFWGIVLMLLYYLSVYPPARAFIMDDHLIYAAIFLLFMVGGAGTACGLDAKLLGSSFVKKYPWVRKLAG